MSNCDHDPKFGGVFLMPKEDHGCVACGYERATTALEQANTRERKATVSDNNFIPQRMPADCAIAALAMFLGVTYEDIARHCTGAELVISGLSWVRENHILQLFKTPCDVFDRTVMDWNNPAILSVPSLNEPDGGA